jgi:hypothetical protein
MNRRVNRRLIDLWVLENAPDGIARLAIKARLSSSLLTKVRSSGRVPTKPTDRRRLAEAIGVAEDELFPLADEKAS